MLAWLCLLGWMLLMTVVVYVGAAGWEFGGLYSKGNDVNWKMVHWSVRFCWIVAIILKVAIWGWW